jgi:P27 family predicted phage terminase small subunit
VRGRKPKSTARRALEGNRGHRPLNAAEPVTAPLDDSFDEPPADFDAVAAAEWRRLAPMLRRSQQIGESDRAALEALCMEWSRYKEALKKVAVLGTIVKSPSGYPMQNPYMSVANRALAACNKLWPELGLTPSSRSRVHTTGASPASRAEQFRHAAPKLRIVK